MEVKGWKYYNHAAIPITPPHEEANIEPIKNGSIWNGLAAGKPLLARWTTDWDCGYETQWWFCIRDGKFSLEELSSSSRKRIRKALKHNTVVKTKIDEDIIDKMYRIYHEATAHYEKADNIQSKQDFISRSLTKKNSIDLFLAYDEGQTLLGYMTVRPEENWVEIETAKFGETAMKVGSSDALYYTILDYYLNQKKVKYVSSGSRNINHVTGTQEYKERVFGYRKAYCKLHIAYKPIVRTAVKLLYPFRKQLLKYDNTTKIHQINAILKMEEIQRSFK